MTDTGLICGPSNSGKPSPLPPFEKDPADVVHDAIHAAKLMAQKRPVPESPTVKDVLKGLEALREASGGAFTYKIQKQTPDRLKVTTELGGVERTIRVRRDFAKLGRGLLTTEMPVESLLAKVVKKAVKKGLVP